MASFWLPPESPIARAMRGWPSAPGVKPNVPARPSHKADYLYLFDSYQQLGNSQSSLSDAGTTVFTYDGLADSGSGTYSTKWTLDASNSAGKLTVQQWRNQAGGATNYSIPLFVSGSGVSLGYLQYSDGTAFRIYWGQQYTGWILLSWPAAAGSTITLAVSSKVGTTSTKETIDICLSDDKGNVYEVSYGSEGFAGTMDYLSLSSDQYTIGQYSQSNTVARLVYIGENFVGSNTALLRKVAKDPYNWLIEPANDTPYLVATSGGAASYQETISQSVTSSASTAETIDFAETLSSAVTSSAATAESYDLGAAYQETLSQAVTSAASTVETFDQAMTLSLPTYSAVTSNSATVGCTVTT